MVLIVVLVADVVGMVPQTQYWHTQDCSREVVVVLVAGLVVVVVGLMVVVVVVV